LQPAPDGVNNDKKKVEQFQMENGDEPWVFLLNVFNLFYLNLRFFLELWKRPEIHKDSDDSLHFWRAIGVIVLFILHH
jgi:hypothetical protein